MAGLPSEPIALQLPFSAEAAQVAGDSPDLSTKLVRNKKGTTAVVEPPATSTASNGRIRV